MTHEVDIVAAGGDAVGYVAALRVPRRHARCCARRRPQLRDGKIVREVVIQAWDA